MPEADLPLTHVHRAPEETQTDGGGAVFVFHGRGADEQDLLPVAARLPDHLHVVSFRAPIPLGPGYTWYGIDASDGLHSSQPDPDDFEAALATATTAIDDAVTAYDIDSENVGLLGFSQGAIMALSLLLEHPTRYAWVVALHGYLAATHSEASPPDIAGTPVFIGAGESDQIIPADRAEAAAARLEDLGCAVTAETFPMGHGIGEAELAAVTAFVDDHA
ncbi:MAG: alpha/beta hydrolase [Halobacteriaceae archaeon]